MMLAHDTREGESGVKRTADIATESNVEFDTMLLAPRTLQGLTAAGFSRPSPVQLQGIPTGKCGFNLLLEAKSGTGKTAVFAVIALELLDAQVDAQVLILAPTREIAAQITNVIKQIGSAYTDLTVEVVMGGLPVQDDIEKFSNKRKVQVIVGSPGRLRHLIDKNYIDIASVRLVILDEADKLIQGAFKPDINFIFSTLPKSKQVIMSSATYPDELRDLVKKYMSKYLHICPDSTSILLGIEQKLTVVNRHSNIVTQTENRYIELLKIFKSRQFKQCLVFCNYQARVVEVCKKLTADKWPAQLLHGQQEQTDRLDALKTLQEYKCRILVSTDLAARGIDACNVDLVVNFEVPYEWATYLHRIGRAGRYGSYGLAITILAKGKEETKFMELLSSLGGPVNMRDLWTDEVVNLDGNSEIVQLKTDNSKIIFDGAKTVNPVTKMINSTKKLWNIMNEDDKIYPSNTGEPQGIEDFEMLIKSYENPNGIECFTDLVNSYENSNIKDADIPFKTVKINYEDIKIDMNTKSEITKKYCNKLIPECENFEKSKSGDDKASTSLKNPNMNLYMNKNKRNTPYKTSVDVKKNVTSKNGKLDNNSEIQNGESVHIFNNDENRFNGKSQKAYCDVDKNIKNSSRSKKSSKNYTSENINGKHTFEGFNKYDDNICDDQDGYSLDPYIDIGWEPMDKLGKGKDIYVFDDNSSKKYEFQPEFSEHYHNFTRSKYKNTNKQKNSTNINEPRTNNSESESSKSDTNSESESVSISESDSDDDKVQWSISSNEGKKLYKTLKKHESIVRTAYKITEANRYEIWTKQLAMKKAQIQMAVYIHEIGKNSRK